MYNGKKQKHRNLFMPSFIQQKLLENSYVSSIVSGDDVKYTRNTAYITRSQGISMSTGVVR
jgi:hypothetical protein